MIWASLLISISGYSWYLAFTFSLSTSHANPWTGLAGLLFLGIVPTFLGFTINRNLIATGPIVYKLILINIRDYLLYAVLTVLGNLFVRVYIFSTYQYPLDWTTYIFPAFWQMLSWCSGTYFIINYAELLAVSRPTSIKSAEFSLMLFIPGVFLLTMMNLPSSLLITLIICWFLTMTLTLTLEGSGDDESSVVRYDLIFFHAIVPSLAALLLYAAFFLRGTHSLLVAIQKAIFSLWFSFLHLLQLFFSEVPEAASPPPIIPVTPVGTGGPVPIKEPQVWIIVLMLVIVLLLLLLKLINILRIRLHPASPLPGSYSVARTFRQVCRWLIMLLCNLFKAILDLTYKVKVIIIAMQQKTKALLRNRFCAKTPHQKVVRSYEAFLRLGHKAARSRRAFETPLEYAQRIEDSTNTQLFPREEINRLTRLFLEARYSQHSINRQQAAESWMLLKTIGTKLKRR